MTFAALMIAAALAPFHSIELRGGGEVIVRHGPQQRVTVRRGDARYSPMAVVNGRLVIDHCRRGCPRGTVLSVEIVTPMLNAASVRDGGLIRSSGGFPRQAEFAAAVSSGGAIDIRSFDAASVAASVTQGGMILTRPGRRLAASVAHGGAITYWGDPEVQRAVSDGGVVARGNAADADRAVADLVPHPAPLPPVPPLPRAPK